MDFIDKNDIDFNYEKIPLEFAVFIHNFLTKASDIISDLHSDQDHADMNYMNISLKKIITKTGSIRLNYDLSKLLFWYNVRQLPKSEIYKDLRSEDLTSSKLLKISITTRKYHNLLLNSLLQCLFIIWQCTIKLDNYNIKSHRDMYYALSNPEIKELEKELQIHTYPRMVGYAVDFFCDPDNRKTLGGVLTQNKRREEKLQIEQYLHKEVQLMNAPDSEDTLPISFEEPLRSEQIQKLIDELIIEKLMQKEFDFIKKNFPNIKKYKNKKNLDDYLSIKRQNGQYSTIMKHFINEYKLISDIEIINSKPKISKIRNSI